MYLILIKSTNIFNLLNFFLHIQYFQYFDSRDVNKIQMGIADKMGIFFQWMSSFIVGVIIGFVYGWKLTLVILAFGPLIMIAALIQDKVIKGAYDHFYTILISFRWRALYRDIEKYLIWNIWAFFTLNVYGKKYHI